MSGRGILGNETPCSKNNRRIIDIEEEKKLAGQLAKMELLVEGCSRTWVFNLRPAGRLQPSGEFCAAREGYFTKYNAL